MIRRTLLIAWFGALAATLAFAGASEAGTCQPVSAKARAADQATATTKAQVKLVKQAARMSGKLMNISTSCKQGALGFECKMSGAVCP